MTLQRRISALTIANDEPLKQIVPKAAALAKVFGCKELVSFAAPEHLGSLMQGLIIPNAQRAVTERVTEVVDGLARVAALLQASEKEIYAVQGNGKRLQKGGSLLWNSKWGWHVLPSSPAETYYSGYINVDLAAKENPQIAEALLALRSAFLPASHRVPRTGRSNATDDRLECAVRARTHRTTQPVRLADAPS